MSDLLATKFALPISVPDRVERSRLTALIQAGVDANHRLVLVSAPAGFGKTTCVLTWLQSHPGRAVSWLSLDEEDDEPSRFCLYLITALQGCRPEIGRELLAVLRSGQLPPLEIINTTLINDLNELTEETILVLDDFHLIQDAMILKLVEKLANNLPPAVRLVLITREDPPFSLARLRANGLLTEVRADDLRFTAPETQVLLTQGLGLTLLPGDVVALEERTEGWAAGLQLAGLSMRGQVDPSAFIAALSGSQRFILNYLVEEVLNRQTEETRRFLLQTSILDRFNASLCNALTGRRDSRALLERLFQANLFLIPLDENHEWFRYHHLFADLLRDQLAARGDEARAELHKRASAWYLQSGQPLAAIEHALAGGDFKAAINLLEEHAVELIFQGHSSRLESFFRTIPPALRGGSIRASLAFAWLYIFRGNIEKALFYYQQLQSALAGVSQSETPLPAATQAEWLALQAMLLSGQGQAEAGLNLAARALNLAPKENAYLLTLIYMSLASAYQILDDFPRAVDAHRQIIRHGRLTENFDAEIMGYAGLCQLLLNHGHYHSGFEAASQGAARLEGAGRMPPIGAALYGSLGEVYFQWRQPEKALANYRRAGQLSRLCGYSDGEISLHAVLSRQHLLAGNLAAAEDEIGQGLERMRQLAPAWVREVALAQQVRVMLAGGRLAEAEAAFRDMLPGAPAVFQLPAFLESQKLTPASGYVYTSALRILLYRAKNCLESDNLTPGLELSRRLIAAALRGEFVLFAIEALLLEAEMHALSGDQAAARTDLTEALRLGEKERLVLVFLEAGQVVHTLLAKSAAGGGPEGISLEYVNLILAALPAASAEPGQAASILTARECEVLRLMSAGLTYEDMAGRLVISLNTVRSHVKAIYGKLNTNNRTQAIAWARKQGLLAD